MAARQFEGGSFAGGGALLSATGLLVGLCLLGAVSAGSLREPLVWKDAGGAVVTFQTIGAMEEFLRKAKVVSLERTPEGINAPGKVLLEKDGVRIYACFRDVKVRLKKCRTKSGVVKSDFRDDAIFELAAYRLALLFGFRNIPPTVERRVKGKKGTVQAWVPDCITEGKRVKEDRVPPSAWQWALENAAVRLFDALVCNEDRNMGNLLIDSGWNVWMIDHTRAFRLAETPVDLNRVQWVERGVWKRLNEVSDGEIRNALRDCVTGREMDTLLSRRRAIVEHLRGQIEALGEGRALFSLWFGKGSAADGLLPVNW